MPMKIREAVHGKNQTADWPLLHLQQFPAKKKKRVCFSFLLNIFVGGCKQRAFSGDVPISCATPLNFSEFPSLPNGEDTRRQN